MVTAHKEEVSKRNWLLVTCVLIPIGLVGASFGIGFVIKHIFNMPGVEYLFYSMGSVFGIGVGFMNYKQYKRSNTMYEALDRQNDKCFECGRIIKPKDDYYFDEKNIYCDRHKRGIKVE